MEYQYYNILELDFCQQTDLNPENSNKLLIGILIVASIIAVGCYMYYKYTYNTRNEPISST
jgi:hypothetical protein